MKNWVLLLVFGVLATACAWGQNNVRMTILLDGYPREVGWKIINSSNTTIIDVPFFTYNTPDIGTTKVLDYAIPAGNYTFQMLDSYGDGLISSPTGNFSLSIIGGAVLASGSGEYDGNPNNNNNATVTVSYNIVIPGSSCASNVNPTVSISATPTAITGSGTVSLSATASDPDGTISKVEFYRNNVLIATDLTSPYTASYSENVVGTYSYYAKAFDNCPTPGVTNSSSVSVTVSSAACNPPTVSISQPANNSTVTAGTNVQVNATATAGSGTINLVRVFYDGGLAATLPNQSPYTYTINSITAGTHTIAINVTNSCGSITETTHTITASGGGGSTCNGWSNNCLTTGNLFRTGAVGIGTSNLYDPSATYLLFVKGGIKAEKMQLELSSAGGWSDYVFAPDYKLMPLKEVAAFLKTRRHLPGMASEAEMQAEGGINVGKIAAQQQAKIEELFLYVIELNQKMENLQKEVTRLNTENKDLKAKIKKAQR